MSRGKASGYVLHNADVPIILGMQKRGDRDHDIAAWFGIKDASRRRKKESLVPANLRQVIPSLQAALLELRENACAKRSIRRSGPLRKAITRKVWPFCKMP
jgi:hypothetical protein